MAVETSLYSEMQLKALDQNKIPYHVAIVMDGNRRWAKKNNLGYFDGHKKGADNLRHIVKAAAALGIKILTVFAFSTENRNRSAQEVAALMGLFHRYLIEFTKTLKEENVKLRLIGDISKLPEKLRKTFEASIEETKECDKIDLVVAINYGGRDDITRAVKKIITDYNQKKIEGSMITEELISSYLDTASLPDPDLLIRTSGELRLSNFLLWQMSYAEFYVVDALWPEFSEIHLYEAIVEYQKRERRFGKA